MLPVTTFCIFRYEVNRTDRAQQVVSHNTNPSSNRVITTWSGLSPCTAYTFTVQCRIQGEECRGESLTFYAATLCSSEYILSNFRYLIVKFVLACTHQTYAYIKVNNYTSAGKYKIYGCFWATLQNFYKLVAAPEQTWRLKCHSRLLNLTLTPKYANSVVDLQTNAMTRLPVMQKLVWLV